MICTPKVRHFWRCIFFMAKKDRRRFNSRESKTQNGDRILKKTECLSSCGRAKERQKAFIIAELRQKYPLKDLLELSGIARSTYYCYLKQKDKDKYESEKQDILEIYNSNKGRYGYRRICAVMKAKGYACWYCQPWSEWNKGRASAGSFSNKPFNISLTCYKLGLVEIE